MEDDELLYQIGEAILTEVDGVEDVTYNRKKKNAFMILTEAGKFYELTLKEVESQKPAAFLCGRLLFRAVFLKKKNLPKNFSGDSIY